MHTSQNVSAKPVRIVEIEVRQDGSKGGLEETAFALIDNTQVRVYRTPKPPPSAITGKNFVAVDVSTAAVLWNKVPDGPGPFVITELK